MQNKRVLHPFAAQEGKKHPRGLNYFKPILGGGFFDREGLFNLEGTMISVLFKELEHKVEKLKDKKAGGHEAE